MAEPKTDRRTVRSREALKLALAEEIVAQGDIARVTVTGVAERSGLTRRTFYSHYRTIQELVDAIEDEAIADLLTLASKIAQHPLAEVFEAVETLEPAPDSVELLTYLKDRQAILAPLLGPGGDASFSMRIATSVHVAFAERALHGIDELALGAFFDYYLTYEISAVWGVIERWINGGMQEPPEVIARLITLLLFVRPGDLYHRSLEANLMTYGFDLMHRLEK